MLTGQFKKSIMNVKTTAQAAEGWHRVSFTADSGARDTVADPRSLPGYPLHGTEASKSGDAFLTAAEDRIPQLGQKEVLILIESGDVRSLGAQCSTVAKPLLSVKRMT